MKEGTNHGEGKEGKIGGRLEGGLETFAIGASGIGIAIISLLFNSSDAGAQSIYPLTPPPRVWKEVEQRGTMQGTYIRESDGVKVVQTFPYFPIGKPVADCIGEYSSRGETYVFVDGTCIISMPPQGQ